MKNEFIHNVKTDYLRILLYFVILYIVLYFGRTLFIPLCFALFLSFIIYPFSKWLEERKVPRGIAILLGILLVSLPISGIILLIVRQVLVFTEKWASVQTKIISSADSLYNQIAGFSGIPAETVEIWVHQGLTEESSDTVLSLLRHVASASSVSIVLLLLIPIYVTLILYYRHIFIRFLAAVFPEQSLENIRSLLKEAITSYYRFVKGMSLVYLCVGLLNSIGLYLLGINDAFFYGFLASVLTIVPYIGIMVGAMVPIAIAWTTYDSVWVPVGIVMIFSVVQILEANIIFPLIVGKGLEVNPLIILIVVIAGGILWGVSGMVLFIPITGMLKIFSERVERLKPLSILLGRNGT